MSSSGLFSYVPGASLLPQVPRLRYQFCFGECDFREVPLDFEKMRRVTVELEPLPYYLGAASLAMFDLARDQREIVATKAAVEKPRSTSELSAPERNRLGHRLDSFLSAARRAQNAVVPYLRQKFRTLSLAKSLRNVVRGIGKGNPQVPEPFRTILLDYWDSHGAALKAYRDLGEHYLIVGSAAKVVVPEQGEPALLFSLPSNPESPVDELRYDNPQVHAQQFVVEQFLSLLACCYTILDQMLDPRVDAALVPALEGSTPMTRKGTGRGDQAYVPIDMHELEAIVINVLRDLRAGSSESAGDG